MTASVTTDQPGQGSIYEYNENPNWPLAFEEYTARHTDPPSSHRAAEAHFGAKGLERDIIDALTAAQGWLTCDQLITHIFGPGPYDLNTAKRLNKVQTMALKLYRRGVVSRMEPDEGTNDVLKYKLRGTL